MPALPPAVAALAGLVLAGATLAGPPPAPAEPFTTLVYTPAHRSAEELVASVALLLPAPSAVIGRDRMIVVRLPEARTGAVREMLEGLDDRPVRTLDVSVARSRTLARADGSAPVAARRIGTGPARAAEWMHTVRVREGAVAHVAQGREVPEPRALTVDAATGDVEVGGIAPRPLGSGYRVRARLAGDRVTVDVATTSAAPSDLPDGGAAAFGRFATTVSGALGAWIPVHRASAGDPAGSPAPGRVLRTAGRDAPPLLVRVDVVAD